MFFSVKHGMFMQSSKQGYPKWTLAIYLMTLHRDFGITRNTAWCLALHIWEAWETR